MAITPETAISELRKAVPSFPIDADWEQVGLAYPTFNDFARYICSEAEVLEFVESREEARRLSDVPVCMEFLERAMEQGDAEVRDLVSECIDTLSACKWRLQNGIGPVHLSQDYWSAARTRSAGAEAVGLANKWISHNVVTGPLRWPWVRLSLL